MPILLLAVGLSRVLQALDSPCIPVVETHVGFLNLSISFSSFLACTPVSAPNGDNQKCLLAFSDTVLGQRANRLQLRTTGRVGITDVRDMQAHRKISSKYTL